MDYLLISFFVYIAIGSIFGYLFLTRELPRIFGEDIDDEELEQDRNHLYDQLHNFQSLVGHQRFIMIFMALFMLFWAPLALYLTYSRIKDWFQDLRP